MQLGNLAGNIYDWTMVITFLGCVVLMVYSIVATISYLTLSSRTSSNSAMDKLATFTGQEAVVTNKGVLRVVGRLMVTIIICTFLLSGGGFLAIRLIYEIITIFQMGFFG